jgi:clan AA aspartic protease (TIGR02281 family)
VRPMRRLLTLVIGVLVGQWLTYSGVQSPAQFDTLAMSAFTRHDYVEAAQLWTRAVSLQPDNAVFHYLRGTALARLGQRQSATDAYQLALMLEPPSDIARLVREGLSQLRVPASGGRASEAHVAVESSRGVWIAVVTINGTHEGRFLVDTGSSVTIVSPAAATVLALPLRSEGDAIELQTLAGKTAGRRSTLRLLAMGDVELHDVPVVVHDPGPGLDGILGNTVLGRYRVTLDADRRILHLRQFDLAEK